MIRFIFSSLTVLAFFTGFCQLPASQIFVLKIQSIQDTPWTLKTISLLTGFNEGSYNNQPFFISEDRLLASIKRIQSTATDIYRFDMQSRTLENLTQSKDHEYSPRIDPLHKSFLTYVHVPSDDTTSQNLVKQNLTGDPFKRFIFYKYDKIGYYRPYKDSTFICFLVSDPPKLGICNQSNNLKKIFSSSIGRCFEVLADGQIIYVDKSEPVPWKLKKYNPKTEISSTIQVLPTGCEDFALDANERIFCTQGSKILRSDHRGSWNTVANLEPYGIRKIQRIAIYKNSIAVVNVP